MKNLYYQTRYNFRGDRNKVWKAICEFIQKYIPKSSTVLDLGCGYCDFINNINAENKIAVDVNSESKKFCNKNIKFISTKSTNLNSIKNESVDTVFSSNLFEHLNDDEFDYTLKEIHRILTKNGLVIVVQPNFKYSYKDYFDDYTHKKIFSHISLKDAFESKNFTLVKSYPKFLPFTFKSIIPKSYILTKIYLFLPFKPMAKQMLLIFKK